jgi:hypothetical protein
MIHRPTVEPNGDGTLTAACPCGWTSPERWATRSDAEAETGAHLADTEES